MLREFENAYIDTYSSWEKKRKLICWITGVVLALATIAAVINVLLGYIVLFVLSGGLIIFGIYVRKQDYKNIKKKSNNNAFKYYDYKRTKFEELKCKIKDVLKKCNMYNKESLEIIIRSFEREISKNNRLSIILSVVSIVIGLFGLKLQALAITVIIMLGLGIALGIPFIVELALKYVLVNKVKYEELVNVLVEIELEVININNKKKKEKTKQKAQSN